MNGDQYGRGTGFTTGSGIDLAEAFPTDAEIAVSDPFGRGADYWAGERKRYDAAVERAAIEEARSRERAVRDRSIDGISPLPGDRYLQVRGTSLISQPSGEIVGTRSGSGPWTPIRLLSAAETVARATSPAPVAAAVTVRRTQMEVPAPRLPATVGGTEVPVRAGILGDILGGVTGASPCAWAKATYPTAAAAAMAFGQTKEGFATIQPGANNGASTAYFEDGQWRVSMCRAGSDTLAGDVVAVGQVSPLPAGGGTIPTVPPPGTPTVPPPGTPTADGCMIPGGVQPRAITQRRCPKKMVLAENGLCYPKKILNVKFRLNKPTPAVISYSDNQMLKRAESALGRWDKFNERIDKLTGRKKLETAQRATRKAKREAAQCDV